MGLGVGATREGEVWGRRVAFLLFFLVCHKKGTKGRMGWGSWRAGEKRLERH